MPITIAVAGKGGTGKTTVAALIIDHLASLGVGDILAIDADPSTNLNLALGVEVEETIGGEREALLEDIQTGQYNLGLEKRQYFQLKIHESLVESDAFDLLAMGRPEGPGCYCAPNHILRQSIDAISGAYDFVVIDNEAGLEHISRRTTRDVDLLLVISDPTVRGLIAARRVFDLVEELGLPLLGMLPQDPTVAELDALGKPLSSLPHDSPVRRQLVSLIGQVLPVAMPV
jgi:CO dehydrogenase maturation factor